MIKYRKFKRSDLIPACQLIFDTYKKFNGREGGKKGLDLYLSYYSPKINPPEKLLANFSRTPLKYVATDGKKIVGILRARPERLVNLFVDGRYHKKGIGRRLILMFENDAKKLRPKTIMIRASLYAAPFYRKMGYKKTTGIRKFHGLKVQPMIKKFK
jgi:GNAT superfamily N-acetyltransferase